MLHGPDDSAHEGGSADPLGESGAPIFHSAHEIPQQWDGLEFSGVQPTAQDRDPSTFTPLETFAAALESNLQESVKGVRVFSMDGADTPFVGINHIIETIQDGGEIPDGIREKLHRFSAEREMLPLLVQRGVELVHPELGSKVKRDVIVIALRATESDGQDTKNPIVFSLPLIDTILPGVRNDLPQVKPYRYHFLAVDGDTFDKLNDLVYDKDARLQALERLDPEVTAKEALTQFFRSALLSGASDIHIEPSGLGDYRIRLRVHGNLQDRFSLQTQTATRLLAQLKIRAEAQVDEKRRPQDGRIDFQEHEVALEPRLKNMSARLSIIPTIKGEKAVLRMLNEDPDQTSYQLDKLGLHPDVLTKVKRLIQNPDGIILITGPTGSGKTTTLYSILQHLNTGERNISTVEDPVEVPLENIAQTQINKSIGLTFPEMLRALLRQDPDIILIGEIRDKETADIASHAAQTGHLVFATLHTNDSFGTVERLRDLDVEKSTIRETLRGVLTQRLVRTLCDECKEPYDAKDDLNQALGTEEDPMPFTESVMLHRAKGVDESGAPCSCCSGLGYTGRIPITEIWVPTPEERDFISQPDLKLEELYKLARSHGMVPMLFHALEEMKKGRTSLEACSGKAISVDELMFRRDEVIGFLKGES